MTAGGRGGLEFGVCLLEASTGVFYVGQVRVRATALPIGCCAGSPLCRAREKRPHERGQGSLVCAGLVVRAWGSKPPAARALQTLSRPRLTSCAGAGQLSDDAMLTHLETVLIRARPREAVYPKALLPAAAVKLLKQAPASPSACLAALLATGVWGGSNVS